MPREMAQRKQQEDTGIQPHRSIVLVGLMGAGKTCVGRRLAKRMGLPFIDADAEIEKAAAMSVSEIFENYGEAEFRDGERRVIARILRENTCVLATGGGAFMNSVTRQTILAGATSVWLKADLDVLVSRTSGRQHRPLLRGKEPRVVLEKLINERYPVYAEADLAVDTFDEDTQTTVKRVLDALEARSEQAD